MPRDWGLLTKRRSGQMAAMAFAAAAASLPSAADAHPHVFAEASLEVAVAPDGTVEKLAHVWRFDDVFSSTVLMEFDKNGDLKLDQSEMDALSKTINDSIAEYKYFQTVLSDGKEVPMVKPAHLVADFPNNQLLIIFESRPEKPLKLDHKVSFGVYDPTFYTAIDYANDADMRITGTPKNCSPKVVRPDPDEAIAANQATLTEAFFTDPTGTDMSKIFATRLEITCDNG
ncbi:DUF1007 family protein [Phyllobacterium leguminum]|uniref:ABC-type uncharacterized transport system substrate-binding protein n=1 Tax=Phyllobacterium leguminum TaxID=314237 RepID=A0A318T612_9HYPH|nr:ABC-type uncharacterized transport system substrate-binding protein [Phyllobacterium leguminum]